MPPEFLYKSTERAGITLFEPRPFWETQNYARSGSAADPQKIPPGANVFHGVYAARETLVPFYFAPRHCPRLSIDPSSNHDSTPVLQRWFGPLPRDVRRLIVFRRPDQQELSRHTFSVYTLDARPFRPLPSGEFLADGPVTPLREARHPDPLAAFAAARWHVAFVDDLDALRLLRTDLHAAGVTRFSSEKL